jgi:hypothetical protein
MEGPVLLHAAWIVTLFSVWIYTRFFQTIAPRSAELAARARERSLLATLAVRPGAEARVAGSLTRAMGPRAEVVPTLAGWPWTHHALRVEVVTSPGFVELRMARARVRRSHEKERPALTDVLSSVLESHPSVVRDNWLAPELYVDVSGRATAEHGWRLETSAGRRRPCRPRASTSNAAMLAPVIELHLRKSA